MFRNLFIIFILTGALFAEEAPNYKQYEKIGIKAFVLPNGMRIVLKSTSFDKGEALFRLIGRGGYLSIKGSNSEMAREAERLFWDRGVGKYSGDHLAALFYQHDIEFELKIDPYSRYLEGTSSTKGLTEVIDTLVELFSHSFQYNQRIQSPKELFDVSFGNLSDFVFVIVGDFNLKEISQLIVERIGALKKNPAKALIELEEKRLKSEKRDEKHTRLSFPLPKGHIHDLDYCTLIIEEGLKELLREKGIDEENFHIGHDFPHAPLFDDPILIIQIDKNPEMTDEIEAYLTSITSRKLSQDKLQELSVQLKNRDGWWLLSNSFWLSTLSVSRNNEEIDSLIKPYLESSLPSPQELEEMLKEINL